MEAISNKCNAYHQHTPVSIFNVGEHFGHNDDVGGERNAFNLLINPFAVFIVTS